MSLNRETFVFGYDTPEQRDQMFATLDPYINKDAGIRITAMSVDHEMRRVSLIEEALERYNDAHDKLSAIEGILECPDLAEWSWDKE